MPPTLFGAAVSAWVIGAVAWVIAVLSLVHGIRSVTRSRLLGVAGGI